MSNAIDYINISSYQHNNRYYVQFVGPSNQTWDRQRLDLRQFLEKSIRFLDSSSSPNFVGIKLREGRITWYTEEKVNRFRDSDPVNFTISRSTILRVPNRNDSIQIWNEDSGFMNLNDVYDQIYGCFIAPEDSDSGSDGIFDHDSDFDTRGSFDNSSSEPLSSSEESSSADEEESDLPRTVVIDSDGECSKVGSTDSSDDSVRPTEIKEKIISTAIHALRSSWPQLSDREREIVGELEEHHDLILEILDMSFNFICFSEICKYELNKTKHKHKRHDSYMLLSYNNETLFSSFDPFDKCLKSVLDRLSSEVDESASGIIVKCYELMLNALSSKLSDKEKKACVELFLSSSEEAVSLLESEDDSNELIKNLIAIGIMKTPSNLQNDLLNFFGYGSDDSSYEDWRDFGSSDSNSESEQKNSTTSTDDSTSSSSGSDNDSTFTLPVTPSEKRINAQQSASSKANSFSFSKYGSAAGYFDSNSSRDEDYPGDNSNLYSADLTVERDKKERDTTACKVDQQPRSRFNKVVLGAMGVVLTGSALYVGNRAAAWRTASAAP